MTTPNPRAVAGDNNPPEPTPFELITERIADLYQTALDFCDGEPIADQQMADTIGKLMADIGAAEKEAETLRVEEKEPHLKAGRDVDAKFKPWSTKTKAGKDACASLLTPWRVEVQRQKAEAAALVAAAAEAARQEAEAAMRASRGDLAARVDAEELLEHSRTVEKQAKRADKAATSGTGLRVSFVANLVSLDEALEHYYSTKNESFEELVRGLAAADVRMGKRTIPGFEVVEEARAR